VTNQDNLVNNDVGFTSHPVLEFTRSTGLMPVLSALGGDQSEVIIFMMLSLFSRILNSIS
jgi:hypothetical protein